MPLAQCIVSLSPRLFPGGAIDTLCVIFGEAALNQVRIVVAGNGASRCEIGLQTRLKQHGAQRMAKGDARRRGGFSRVRWQGVAAYSLCLVVRLFIVRTQDMVRKHSAAAFRSLR